MPDSLVLWPFVITVEDCYIPHSAPYVIEGVGSLDDRLCAVTMRYLPMKPGINLQWQVN